MKFYAQVSSRGIITPLRFRPSVCGGFGAAEARSCGVFGFVVLALKPRQYIMFTSSLSFREWRGIDSQRLFLSVKPSICIRREFISSERNHASKIIEPLFLLGWRKKNPNDNEINVNYTKSSFRIAFRSIQSRFRTIRLARVTRSDGRGCIIAHM